MAGRNFYPLVGDLKFDAIDCDYDGSNNLVTVEYLLANVVQMTLTLTYDGSNNLQTVERAIPS